MSKSPRSERAAEHAQGDRSSADNSLSRGYRELCGRSPSCEQVKTVTKTGCAALIAILIAACVVPCHAGTTLEEGQLHQHDDWWSIEIKYPILEGDSTFNAAVLDHVRTMATGFRKSLPETASKGYPDYGAYLKGAYTAQILKNGMISVLLSYAEYTPGAAHPWGVMASINYDRRSARIVRLSDLFRPGSNYVSRLSEISIHELGQREYAEGTAIRQGAGPVEKNFAVFTLTDTELVLHFQQYQVAAGAVPSEQVSIPWKELAPLLRKGAKCF